MKRRLPPEYKCPVVLFIYLAAAIGFGCFWTGYGAGRGIYPDTIPLIVSGLGVSLCILGFMVWKGLHPHE